MEKILLELLENLESVGERYEELFDSEVRESMGNAVFRAFIKREAGYSLPDDFGMYSLEANAEVKSALADYVASASVRAANLGIDTFHQRLAAFQNSSVRTSGRVWNDFDEFFGTSNPAAFDSDGNVINSNLR